MYNGYDNPNLLTTFYNSSNILKLIYLYYYLDHNDLVRLILSCKDFYRNKNMVYNLIFQQLIMDKSKLQIYKGELYIVSKTNSYYCDYFDIEKSSNIFILLYVNNTLSKKAEKSKYYKIKLLLKIREKNKRKQENNIL